MINLPLKTRQRILRNARMRIASGECDFIIGGLIMSYRSVFKHLTHANIIKEFPELRKRGLDKTESCLSENYKRQERVNLLSDAITELNQKVKEEEYARTGIRMDQGKRPYTRRKATYRM